MRLHVPTTITNQLKICLISAIGLILLATNQPLNKQDPIAPRQAVIFGSGEEMNDEAKAALTKFAIQTSVVGFGINSTVLRKRSDSAIGLLWELASEDELVSRTFSLTEAQLDLLHDRWNDLSWPPHLHFADETHHHPDFYDCLSTAQHRSLELAAMRLDGMVALTRSFFVRELKIVPEQLEKIREKMVVIRESNVMPRFRRTFVGGYTSKDIWDATVDAVAFNTDVLVLLDDQQKARLVSLEIESRKFDEVVSHVLELSWSSYND